MVSAENPWSSKQIVETLCPPISETGNPVVCYPVAGYPLGCKVSWEPTQAGTGDPSPENIRPISGRDSISVERCGGNVVEFLSTNDSSESIKIAVDAEKNITLNGTLARGGNITIGMCRLHWVAGKTYTMYVKKVGGSASLGSNDGITFAYSLFTTDYNHYFRGDTNSKNLDAYIASNAALAETELVFMLQCWRANTVFNNFKFQIEVVEGTTAPTTYKPYIGSINALTLPETIYGGTLDAVTGAGQETWGFCTLTGQEPYHIFSGMFYLDTPIAPAADYDSGVCSHYKFKRYKDGHIGITDRPVYRPNGDYTPDDDGALAWKSYLAAQAAAGTPVQIAYKLVTPTPIHATGAQPVQALAGCNTVLTDADSVNITGRADPIHAIAELQDALAATVDAQTLANDVRGLQEAVASIVDD